MSSRGTGRNAWLAMLAGLAVASGVEAQLYVVPGGGGGHPNYPDLSSALAAVSDGETIFVSNGTWSGAGNCDLSFGRKDVTIRSLSGDPTTCVIDCTGAGRFITLDSANEGTSIQSLTLRHGASSTGGGSVRVEEGTTGLFFHELRFNSNYSANRGGAMVIHRDSDAIMTECWFTSNDAEYGGALAIWSSDVFVYDCVFSGNETFEDDGGAVYVQRWSPNDVEPSVILSESLIQGNTSAGSGGGVWSGVAEVVVHDCTVTGNLALVDGGGVAGVGSDLFIQESSFSGNDATRAGALFVDGGDAKVLRTVLKGNEAPNSSAVRLLGGASARFDNCELLDNEGGSTVGIFESSSGSFMNALFAGNDSSFAGAGAYVGSGSSLVVRCSTLSENHSDASSGAGVYVVASAYASIANSIFWENDASGGTDELDQIAGPGTIDVSFTCIQNLGGTYAGSDNTGDDPAFEDPVGGDFRLTLHSPAINAGDNSLRPFDACDLDGDGNLSERLPFDLDDTDRVKFGTIDLGAYESPDHPADFNGDGELSILDFIAFQQAFQAGDPKADINGDGVLDILDFIAFQLLFG